MRRQCVLAVLLGASQVQAGGLVVVGSPRSIGRAGTATVGDDGAGALLANPAAMARRDGARAQLGIAFVDDELAWQSPTPEAPIARDQAPSSMVPYGAGFATVRGWVIGLGAMTSSVTQRSFRPPRDVPTEDIGPAFDFRYNGIAGGIRRNTVTLGVARRVGNSFAFGLALSASRIELTEIRRMWAGFSGRDMIGSPFQDLEVGFTGVDELVPGAVTGVLFAPEGTTIELGASLSWLARARIEADVLAFGTRPRGPSVVTAGPVATLDLDNPLTARFGGRYLGDRFVVELGGELAYVRRSAADTEWNIVGMNVVDFTGVEAPLERVPSRVSMRQHGAVRMSLDLELAAGFLWATTGYAYTVGSVGVTKQSPTFGDLGGHTFAVGLEGTAGGFTFTLGWSRTWSVGRTVQPDFTLDNPFNAGDATVLPGQFDGSIDQIGISLDAEFGRPN